MFKLITNPNCFIAIVTGCFSFVFQVIKNNLNFLLKKFAESKISSKFEYQNKTDRNYDNS